MHIGVLKVRLARSNPPRGHWFTVFFRRLYPIFGLALWALLVAGSLGAGPIPLGTADQHCNEGMHLLREGNWKGAIAEFNLALKTDPTSEEAYVGLGVALSAMGDKSGSIAAFRSATKVDPKSSEAHYNLALGLRESGETKEAFSELETALSLRPGYDEADLAIGQIL